MPDVLSKPTLPTFSWIGQLKPDDRDLLSSYGEFFPAYPGTAVINEGAMQTAVFVVISGQLEVRAKQDDETEALLAHVGPGETLGEISLFHPGPAAATVRAVEFSQLWRIADNDLISFMEENPGAGNLLLRTLASILAQRLRQTNPRAFGISTYAVVDSPELARQAPPPAVEELPVADSPELARETPPPAVEEPSVADSPELTRETPPPAVEEPPVIETPPAIISAPASEAARKKKQTDALAIPKPDDDTPPPQATGAPRKRVSTKTQVIPDPDDLGPL